MLLLAKEYGSGISSLGPDLLDHCLLRSGAPFARNTSVQTLLEATDEQCTRLLGCLAEGSALFASMPKVSTSAQSGRKVCRQVGSSGPTERQGLALALEYASMAEECEQEGCRTEDGAQPGGSRGSGVRLEVAAAEDEFERYSVWWTNYEVVRHHLKYMLAPRQHGGQHPASALVGRIRALDGTTDPVATSFALLEEHAVATTAWATKAHS